MNTDVRRFNGNQGFRDNDYSPAVGASMWEDCPVLAALQDPALAHRYFNDFYDYTAADWTITTTETGGGSATEALSDAAGGVLLITNDDADNESDEFQKDGEAFQLVVGKPLWFEARMRVSEATEVDFLVGLCITDTTLIDGLSDGVYFLKDDGDTAIDYHCEKDSGDSTGNTGVNLSTAYRKYGIHFNGAGQVDYWLDGVRVASVTGANVPDDELLSISFAIQNGDGNARNLSVDYIKCFQVR